MCQHGVVHEYEKSTSESNRRITSFVLSIIVGNCGQRLWLDARNHLVRPTTAPGRVSRRRWYRAEVIDCRRRLLLRRNPGRSAQRNRRGRRCFCQERSIGFYDNISISVLCDKAVLYDIYHAQINYSFRKHISNSREMNEITNACKISE